MTNYCSKCGHAENWHAPFWSTIERPCNRLDCECKAFENNKLDES